MLRWRQSEVAAVPRRRSAWCIEAGRSMPGWSDYMQNQHANYCSSTGGGGTRSTPTLLNWEHKEEEAAGWACQVLWYRGGSHELCSSSSCVSLNLRRKSLFSVWWQAARWTLCSLSYDESSCCSQRKLIHMFIQKHWELKKAPVPPKYSRILTVKEAHNDHTLDCHIVCGHVVCFWSWFNSLWSFCVYIMSTFVSWESSISVCL